MRLCVCVCVPLFYHDSTRCVFRGQGGLVHWTHVGGPLHEPLSEELLLFHDIVANDEDWRETDRIHVVADCWKLQRPGMRAVTFDVNATSGGADKPDGQPDADSAGPSDVSAADASEEKEGDGGRETALSGDMDRGCLWFPYTPLRDFWYLAPLNFWKGYIDSAADLNPRCVRTHILHPTESACMCCTRR